MPCIGESAIVILPLGNVERVLFVSKYLKDQGIYANAIMSPGVRKGDELVRFNITLTHTYEELALTATTIKEAIRHAGN